MIGAEPAANGSLRVLHILRAPLGGLFRHVVDLAREQIARGHKVGIVCDSTTGGESGDRMLAELSPGLALGLSRVPMHRNPNPDDLATLAHVMKRTRATQPDIVHGHGSKGGLYARLPGLWSSQTVRAYTPHGGSFNYRPGTPVHRVYMMAERLLKRGTDIFLFESAFIADRFRAFAGDPGALTRVVWNGIGDAEFIPVEAAPDAVDFLYIGELRAAKGIDTFIDAIAEVDRVSDFRPRAVMAGTGPDREQLVEQAARRGLSERIRFLGAMRARDAFARARVMVVPSRAESLPYVVLEAAGACLPMVATNVGGIPEIFGPHAGRLIPCDDPALMAANLLRALRQTPQERASEARDLAQFVASRFTVAHMVDAVIAGYREAIAARHLQRNPVSRTALQPERQ